MVAFIIFGVFALTRRFGRVLLIPVLAARSASRRPCGDVSSARFATALSARSTSADIRWVLPHGELCHGAGRTECIGHGDRKGREERIFATALAARSAS